MTALGGTVQTIHRRGGLKRHRDYAASSAAATDTSAGGALLMMCSRRTFTRTLSCSSTVTYRLLSSDDETRAHRPRGDDLVAF